ncbi:UDP-N-acetylmuramoylalanyl-D-glutamyl-2,6- diaminopimelate--D-alanyl-D-alanine ligase [Caballeronia sordidicola]|uniref:UDP-N-acetylmuramoylalanyl-D-glutamyl-2,6-diaminopimelate--D-alanyl-D-alanine ligase n=1 Tax=Caballeronia sordidicola TaxID=196367 RepID=A0A226X0N4_CABSO|nr:UDP-N-acetylmuramoylalanyl-D-glutamyl-2,6- diaminopimelate--D-alanyl-D-alanine ligase [Caballeronia sordidicola]
MGRRRRGSRDAWRVQREQSARRAGRVAGGADSARRCARADREARTGEWTDATPRRPFAER